MKRYVFSNLLFALVVVFLTDGRCPAGRIVAWGDNTYGQCSAPPDEDFVAIAAGRLHCLGLKVDGSVVAWGNNTYGQCDAPQEKGFTAIAAGGYHSVAIRRDGSVAAWGWDKFGQCRCLRVAISSRLPPAHVTA